MKCSLIIRTEISKVFVYITVLSKGEQEESQLSEFLYMRGFYGIQFFFAVQTHYPQVKSEYLPTVLATYTDRLRLHQRDLTGFPLISPRGANVRTPIMSKW